MKWIWLETQWRYRRLETERLHDDYRKIYIKHQYSGRNTLWISSKKEDNIAVDIGGLMKLITPFTILNQNFHEIDLIRDAMKNRKLAKEKLHDDYRNRKMYKYHQFA